MRQEARDKPSHEHEEVYHAASLSLTARRLHDLKQACSGEGQNTGVFASKIGVL